MRRRTFLGTVGVSLTAALAGCSDGEVHDTKRTVTATETASSVPTDDETAIERTIRALWTAYSNENAEGVVDVYHPDSPDEVTTESLTFRGTVTVENITVTGVGEAATAEADITLTDGENTLTERHVYELRQYEGEWVLWTFIVDDSGDGTATGTPADDTPQRVATPSQRRR